MKTAAFFDFDDTLIDTNSSKIGFKWLYDNKLLSKGFLLKTIVIGFFYKIHLISNKRMADSLIKFYKNKKLEYFTKQADEFYENLLKPRFIPEMLEKVEEHKKQGHYLVIVSGSIRYYLEPVAKDLGFDNIICTDLEEGSDGLLTGKPIGKICIDDYKRELALQLVEKENIDLKNSFAYGDNESDIQLLKLVGNPVAVQPSPKLRKLAQKNNWQILTYNN